MINEKETFEKYGYYAHNLKPYSEKLIVACCDVCGKVRIVGKHHYRALCGSCAKVKRHKDHPITDKTRKLMSSAWDKRRIEHPITDETKKRMSETQMKRFEVLSEREKISEWMKRYFDYVDPILESVDHHIAYDFKHP